MRILPLTCHNHNGNIEEQIEYSRLSWFYDWPIYNWIYLMSIEYGYDMVKECRKRVITERVEL